MRAIVSIRCFCAVHLLIFGCPPRTPSAKGMDSAGARQKLPGMGNALGNKALLSGPHGDAFEADDDGIFSLKDNEVFVKVMNMLSGFSAFVAMPKRHLAPVRTIKYISFDSSAL